MPTREEIRPWQDAETLEWANAKFDRNKDAADVLGCGRRTVDRWMNRHDIPETADWKNEDTLRKWFIEENMSQHEIAELTGKAQMTIAHWLEKFDICKHECPQCDRSLPTEHGLKIHHMNAHGESIAGVQLECEQCGEQFRRPESHASGNAFCSRDCLWDWMSGRFTGKDHWRWVGGERKDYGVGWNERKRASVRERDGNQCRDCGISNDRHQEIFECELHVHHIRPADEFQYGSARNAMSNLVTFCCECHMKWEYDRTPEQLRDFLASQ